MLRFENQQRIEIHESKFIKREINRPKCFLEIIFYIFCYSPDIVPGYDEYEIKKSQFVYLFFLVWPDSVLSFAANSPGEKLIEVRIVNVYLWS